MKNVSHDVDFLSTNMPVQETIYYTIHCSYIEKILPQIYSNLLTIIIFRLLHFFLLFLLLEQPLPRLPLALCSPSSSKRCADMHRFKRTFTNFNNAFLWIIWEQIIYEWLLRLSAVILCKVKQKVLTMIALFLTNFFFLLGPLSLNFKINNGKLSTDSQIFIWEWITKIDKKSQDLTI